MEKHLIFYLMFIPAMILFLLGIWFRANLYLQGSLRGMETASPWKKFITLAAGGWKGLRKRPGWYLKIFLTDAIFHKRLYSQSFYRWLAHTLLVFGFIATFIVDMIKGFTTGYLAAWSGSLPFLSFAHAFKTGPVRPFLDFFLELFSFFILVGCLMAMVRRFFIKPHQLRTEEEDIVTLAFIFYMVASGFFIEGYRIAHPEVVAERVYMADFTPPSANNWISFFGYFLSFFLKDVTINPHFLWYAHVIPCLVWFVYIPHSKFIHIFTSTITVMADRSEQIQRIGG